MLEIDSVRNTELGKMSQQPRHRELLEARTPSPFQGEGRGAGQREGLVLPAEFPHRRHVYHVFAIRTAEPRALQRQLLAADIQTAIHYPRPVHLQPAYADFGYREGDFPEAERLAAEELSLPIDPELSTAQIAHVCSAMKHSCAAFAGVTN